MSSEGDEPPASDPPARVRLPILPEDVERGLRFNHMVEHQTRAKLADLSASFYALVETMIARGVVPVDEYE